MVSIAGGGCSHPTEQPASFKWQSYEATANPAIALSAYGVTAVKVRL